VHLAHPDVVGDLRLGLALVEAEVEYLLLLVLQAADGFLEQDLVLQPVYRGAVISLEVHDGVTVGLVLAHGGVEARGVVGPAEGKSFGYALHVGVQDRGELLDRRRAARPHGLVPDRLLRRLPELLQATRDAHRPALVAEVALDLPEDVRRSVSRELYVPVHVEAVYGLDQADGGHLHQVVHGLAAACELAGKELGEGELLLDHPLAGAFIAFAVVTL
jgi:hypothetical protein